MVSSKSMENITKTIEPINILSAFNFKIDLIELTRQLKAHNIINYDDIEHLDKEIWLNNFARKINNTTPEEIQRNKDVVAYKNPSSYRLSDTTNPVQVVLSKEDADKIFWNILASDNPVINRKKMEFDQTADKQYNVAIRRANAQAIRDKEDQLLDYSELAIPIDIRTIFPPDITQSTLKQKSRKKKNKSSR